ncbi:YoaK family protein [Streptomyces sp. TR06-5]|uniref:YoaK family protein n=1 Tax=Streptomyces sp. TR06-5 TaxID=3385976 RepID=UPI0039A3F3F8
MAEVPSSRRVAGLLVLTFSSGMVDAVGFIALGHVFCALATGNVLFLGLAVAGEPQLGVSNTVAALGSFVVGLAAGHHAILRLLARGRDWFRITIGAETVVLAAAAAAGWGLTARPPGELGLRHYGVVVMLALAMGARTATTHRVGVPGLSTILITTSLALLFGTPPGGSGEVRGDARAGRTHRRRYLTAVLSIFCGAVAGTLLLRLGVTAALVVAAGCAAAVLFVDGGGRARAGPARPV